MLVHKSIILLNARAGGGLDTFWDLLLIHYCLLQTRLSPKLPCKKIHHMFCSTFTDTVHQERTGEEHQTAVK